MEDDDEDGSPGLGNEPDCDRNGGNDLH